MEGVSYHYPVSSAGGNKQLSIVYFNARSLVPKFDELCTLVESMQPDITLGRESVDNHDLVVATTTQTSSWIGIVWHSNPQTQEMAS